MTDAHELEAKFEAGAEARLALERLERFGHFVLVRRETKEQDDRYYDTDDERLKRAGASLRIRRTGSRTQMTFKGERQDVGGGDEHMISRLEDEVDIPAEAVTHLTDESPLSSISEPSPLLRGRELAGRRELRPTARIVTHRTVSLFENQIGDRLELAVDLSRAVRLVDLREVGFVEVEVELKHGEPQALVGASTDLQEAVPGLIPSTRTKLERALH